MGMWYLAPVDGISFATGMKNEGTAELKDIAAYLEGIKASGFHVGGQFRAVKHEIEHREERERKLKHG